MEPLRAVFLGWLDHEEKPLKSEDAQDFEILVGNPENKKFVKNLSRGAVLYVHGDLKFSSRFPYFYNGVDSERFYFRKTKYKLLRRPHLTRGIGYDS